MWALNLCFESFIAVLNVLLTKLKKGKNSEGKGREPYMGENRTWEIQMGGGGGGEFMREGNALFPYVEYWLSWSDTGGTNQPTSGINNGGEPGG